MSAVELFVERVNGIPTAEELSEDQLRMRHPFNTIIHRRARTKDALGTARSGREFTRHNDNGTISVTMDRHRATHKQGMSCSTSCCYKNHVMSGNIPLEFLPSTLYEMQEVNNCVIIGGKEFELNRCFHRTISDGAITVGEALDTLGDHDSCLIDDNFVMYFESTDHALIRLRRETIAYPDVMEFGESNQIVTFKHPFFDKDSWIECPMKFAKVPLAIMTALLRGKLYADLFNEIDDKFKDLFEALQCLFAVVNEDDTRVVNTALELVMQCSSVIVLGAESKRELLNLFDEHMDKLWSDDDDFYRTHILPTIDSL